MYCRLAGGRIRESLDNEDINEYIGKEVLIVRHIERRKDEWRGK